jgi:hypothetical protein
MPYLKRGLSPASLLTLLVFLPSPYAAQRRPAVICAESWKRGDGRIKEQTLTVTVGAEQPTFAAVIPDSEGRRQFKLSLRHHPAGREYYELEYWTVHLSQVKNGAGEEDLGDNLLLAAQPGPGKHYFPKGDLIGYLYPREQPKRFLENYFPIYGERVVKVEGFYVVINVNSYSYGQQNSKLVHSMNVSIEFRNDYVNCETSSRL